jgi:hypothetical protein
MMHSGVVECAIAIVPLFWMVTLEEAKTSKTTDAVSRKIVAEVRSSVTFSFWNSTDFIMVPKFLTKAQADLI